MSVGSAVSFIPPTISANNPVFLDGKVYATTDLSFEITPPYDVNAGSKIVITLPNYRNGAPPIYFFGPTFPGTVACIGTLNIESSITCNPIDKGTSISLTINGGFTSKVDFSKKIQFTVKGVRAPLSMSKVVCLNLTRLELN